MGIITRLLRRRDPRVDAAERLLPAAQLAATSMFAPIVSQHATLRDVELPDWDFFVPVAAVYLALMRLRDSSGGRSYEEVAAIAAAALVAWNRDAARAFTDCGDFVQLRARSLVREGSEYAWADAAGMWVLWNLHRSEPTLDQAQAARAVGTCLVDSFYGWWD